MKFVVEGELGKGGRAKSSWTDVSERGGNLCDSSGVMCREERRAPRAARREGRNWRRASRERVRSSVKVHTNISF